MVERRREGVEVAGLLENSFIFRSCDVKRRLTRTQHTNARDIRVALLRVGSLVRVERVVHRGVVAEENRNASQQKPLAVLESIRVQDFQEVIDQQRARLKG